MAKNFTSLEAELETTLARVRELASQIRPITPGDAAGAPTWRAAYSDRTSALMATFCDLAYDRFEESTGAAREALSLKLAGGGFRLVNVYNVNACTQAFLATGEQFAVLAFRGTESAEDWRINLNSGLQPFDPRRPQVKVHQGFLSAFRSVEALIRADLDANVPDTLGLYITGHSLGGALAQVASAALARDNLAACYTFGSPRVGGKDFDYEVKCPHYRVVNAWDLVPAIPPPLWRGYLHGGDVRTLKGKGTRPLRRNRLMIDAALKTLLALAIYPFNRRLFLIDDHMIGNYRDKLSVVAAERSRPSE